MIDAKTGHLVIDDEHSVTAETNLQELEEMQLGAHQNIRRMGNAWTWVDVKNLKIEEHYLNISFLFHGKSIRGFSFVFQDKPYDLKPSWDTWSKKTEVENLQRFNNWLDHQLGEKRELDWGKFWAVYDPKSSASFIGLRYAREA